MDNTQKAKIAIYPINKKLHSIYGSTIKLFNNNFDVKYKPEVQKYSNFISKLSRNKFLKTMYQNYVRRFITLNDIVKPDNKLDDKDIDLIFASNNIPPGKSPFVLDLEIVTALAGYNYRRLDKKLIKKELESSRCKAIICWNKASKDSLLGFIKSKKIEKKISIVPFAIDSSNIPKKLDDITSFLFVSSVNNPYDFEQKGGIIALEAYKKILEKNQNVEFVVRSNIPKWVQKKYSSLKGLKMVTNFLSDKEMEDLFVNSDILLEPVPGISLVLECMKYSIPGIIFDFWCLPEMVLDKKTGFLVDSSSILGKMEDGAEYFNHGLNYLRLFNKKPDENIVSKFADHALNLSYDKELLMKMRVSSNNLVAPSGKYNLESRNYNLMKILNNVVK